MKKNTNPVPQMRVHTDLIAGESVDACLRNLSHWTNQLEKKCSKRGNSYSPGYTPYLETEMLPWQAGGV